MEMWQLYLLATLDGWSNTFMTFSLLLGFLCVGALFVWLATLGSDTNEAKQTRTFIKTLLPYTISFFVVFTLLIAAVPSSKNAWIMAGAYVATNIEDVADLPPNVLKALNRFLQQYVEEETKP